MKGYENNEHGKSTTVLKADSYNVASSIKILHRQDGGKGKDTSEKAEKGFEIYTIEGYQFTEENAD